MNDIANLYQELIIDHGKNPRNFKKLGACTHEKEGYNPLCGDKLIVYLLIDDGIVSDISFEGCGCAISMASASLMSQSLKGKSLVEVESLFKSFHHLVTEQPSEVELDSLGKLSALAGVREYPMRVKCATLAWHTMRAALNDSSDVATTE
jgi:nitrogen fixation protein NifU and related proteins